MRFAILMTLFVSFQAFSEEESVFIVELEAKTAAERSEIAQLIHIDSIVNDRVFSVVHDGDMRALSKNPHVKVVSAESLFSKRRDNYFAPFSAVIDFPDADARYHTYDETTTALDDLAKDYSGLVQKFSIGKTVENREIWGIRISDDSGEPREKKAIVYMGTHHAREHLSTEIAIMFAQELLEQSDTENAIKDLLKTLEIFVIPIVNPDGAIHDITNKSYKWWRKNRRANGNNTFGVDLNRNYSFGWGTGGSSTNPSSDVYMGRSPFSEPETAAIRDFFAAHDNITVALTLHTFSELVLYPWGGRNDGIGGEDEVLFKKMADDMAEMNGYEPMQSSELYIASGDTCDWAYGVHGVFCFTFELSPSSMFGGGFYPGASIIDQVFDDNWEPMLYLANKTLNPRE